MGTIIIEGKTLSLDGLKPGKTLKAFELLAETLKIKDAEKAWSDIKKALGRDSKKTKKPKSD